MQLAYSEALERALGSIVASMQQQAELVAAKGDAIIAGLLQRAAEADTRQRTLDADLRQVTVARLAEADTGFAAWLADADARISARLAEVRNGQDADPAVLDALRADITGLHADHLECACRVSAAAVALEALAPIGERGPELLSLSDLHGFATKDELEALANECAGLDDIKGLRGELRDEIAGKASTETVDTLARSIEEVAAGVATTARAVGDFTTTSAAKFSELSEITERAEWLRARVDNVEALQANDTVARAAASERTESLATGTAGALDLATRTITELERRFTALHQLTLQQIEKHDELAGTIIPEDRIVEIAAVEAERRMPDIETARVQLVDFAGRTISDEVARAVPEAVAEATIDLEPLRGKIAETARAVAELRDDDVAARSEVAALVGELGVAISNLQTTAEATAGELRAEIDAARLAAVREADERITAVDATGTAEAAVARYGAALRSRLGEEIATVVAYAVEPAVAEAVAAIDREALRGAPGRLPAAVPWTERVFYEGEVATHDGATWQARKDTGRPPVEGDDWIELAAAGRSPKGFTLRGLHDATVVYDALDVVVLKGSSFVARRDNPGECPGEGWQLWAHPGRKGDTVTVKEPAPEVVPTGLEVNDEGLLTLKLSDGRELTADFYALLKQVSR